MDQLAEMIEKGMDIVRINMAYGSFEVCGLRLSGRHIQNWVELGPHLCFHLVYYFIKNS